LREANNKLILVISNVSSVAEALQQLAKTKSV